MMKKLSFVLFLGALFGLLFVNRLDAG